MDVRRVAIVGTIDSLAVAAAKMLEQRGHNVTVLAGPCSPEQLAASKPSRLLVMPFPNRMNRSVLSRTESYLANLRSVLQWAAENAVSRVVLRSHAVAFGISMKNPGLLDESRISLLPNDSQDRRWIHAEEAVLGPAGGSRRRAAAARRADVGPQAAAGGFTAAAARLTTVLDPDVGDLVTLMLSGHVAVPLAGYDPQLQLLTLEDAAEALVSAVLADATGVFNISPRGTVPVKSALKASVPLRIPVSGVLQKPVRSLLWKAGLHESPGEALDRVKYNWTVSSERARSELGFTARTSSPEALRQYLSRTGRGRPHRVRDDYDEFGLDPAYLRKWDFWFKFLAKVYWRVEAEGVSNIPAEEPALLVANHRGFMPFDGVIHRTLILEARNRHIRFLVIPSLFKFPFLSDFLVKQGGVVASQANTKKLFDRKDLVGIFPEGINGAFRMYRGAYQIGDMSRNAFARMAIDNGVPIIPAAAIGHVEIFPILAKVRSSLVTRLTGWPFLPITPTFPLLPVPLPTKWHIRYLEPVPVEGYRAADARNPEAVNELAGRVRSVMQRHIDEMLRRRKHIFFGDIFGGERGREAGKSIGATG